MELEWTTLYLYRNVISRPSGSNSAVLNKSKDIAIAGVREFIFVWDIASEQLLKHFQAHYGRILRSLHCKLQGSGIFQ